MKLMIRSLFAGLLLLTSSAWALEPGTPVNFETEEQLDLYKDMLHELRCTVCQNQSLADSNAKLAADLRTHLYEMVDDGKNKDEIKTFMVDRYGEFVLYRPTFSPSNYLLWFGPFVLLLIGIIVFRMNIRSRGAIKEEGSSLSEQEKAELSKYMGSKKESE